MTVTTVTTRMPIKSMDMYEFEAKLATVIEQVWELQQELQPKIREDRLIDGFWVNASDILTTATVKLKVIHSQANAHTSYFPVNYIDSIEGDEGEQESGDDYNDECDGDDDYNQPLETKRKMSDWEYKFCPHCGSDLLTKSNEGCNDEPPGTLWVFECQKCGSKSSSVQYEGDEDDDDECDSIPF